MYFMQLILCLNDTRMELLIQGQAAKSLPICQISEKWPLHTDSGTN